MINTMRNRPALGLTVAAALLSLTACGGGDTSADKPAASDVSTTGGATDAQSAPGPDAAGIPDVVAEVNGQDVTKEEFLPLYEARLKQAASQAQSGGAPPDQDALKKETADNLVNTTLLAQEAKSRGISVTTQDVDDNLASLAKQNHLGSVDELLAAVEKQGVTEDQARAQLESQIVIEKLIKDQGRAPEPTERDLRRTYDQAKQQAGQGQKIPPYAKVKAQLVAQAKSKEFDKVATRLVGKLRAAADIVIHL